MEINATKKRKSGFNPDRKTYFTADGKYYCYMKWDAELKRDVPMKYEVGKDISSEITFILDDMDHQEDLNNRYQNELKDPLFESRVNSYEDDLDSDEALDPWDTVADKVKSPEEVFFAEPEPENSQELKVRQIIEEYCTEAQKNFFYDHFGMTKQLEQMRQEEVSKTGQVLSKQAITNRKNKLLDKVAKALGAERVKRCAMKEQG